MKATIETLEQQVKDHSYREYDNDVTIDVQTANAMLTVYSHLNEIIKKSFRQRLEEDPIKLGHICWSLVKSAK